MTIVTLMKEYLLFLLIAVLWDISGQSRETLDGASMSLSLGMVLPLVHTNMWWTNCLMILRVIAEALWR
jgi:hypothetical protein